ncbi:Spo0E family sporulation regulatory protein-aspartic acid phosphatase [Paenibacillus sp. LMG 31461]|uniref:Spo0E family sporulation regulatory protein-aspartic acid phosphatase n=1 Tax=Paenibacillus plantarum TaxID=2654975 RepID=A0ABX1X8T4_9BACL|nr:aspartyl-phosphate phosphatase Spo0E family protein [Paenibacillus plantarum]NOU64370.1 Spo0E family sporulation regulatory protein-aspartic acid phosphatase [Paenibacillus plantarum]
MDKASKIKKAIEAKREEMLLVGMIFGLESEVVLSKSKELDDLLNRFDSLKKLHNRANSRI